MDNKLFKAILSMDSYNRGYNAGIVFGSDPLNSEAIDGITQIGSATIVRSANTSQDQSAGFYAIAYDIKDAQGNVIDTVISYRGTDESISPVADDVLNGYGVGTGSAHTAQSAMAFEFYRAVADGMAGTTGSDPLAANISLTGHSMGGGFAGLVAAAYGKDAEVFEHMAYASSTSSLVAARNLQIADPSVYAIMYSQSNPQAPYDPDFLTAVYGDPAGATAVTAGTGVNSTGITGEALDYLTSGTPDVSLSLGPSVDLPGVDSLNKHDAALQVIRLYAETEVAETDWLLSAKYFWSQLYNNSFAQSIGATLSGRYVGATNFILPDHNYDTVLRTALAYSAIDEGADDITARPFGDTGIVSLYDDASDFGKALYFSDTSRLNQFSTYISQAMVQYAGALALNKILQSDRPDVLGGVLTYREDTQDHSLSVNFSDDLWTFGGVLETDIQARSALLAGAGFGGTSVQNLMNQFWGTSSASVISKVIFPRYDNSYAAINGSQVPLQKASMYIGTETDDTVVAHSQGNYLMNGYGGVDTVQYTGSGITATLARSAASGAITVSKGTSVGRDILLGFEGVSYAANDNLAWITVRPSFVRAACM